MANIPRRPRLSAYTQRAHREKKLEPSPVWVSTAIEEYKSVRDESARALQNQLIIFQIAVTALSALAVAALTLTNLTYRLVLSGVTAQLLILSVVIVWRGEVHRSIRAGSYLREREKMISLSLKELSGLGPALDWESWLGRNPKFRLWGYYKAQLLVLMSYGAFHMFLAVTATLNLRAWWEWLIVG